MYNAGCYAMCRHTPRTDPMFGFAVFTVSLCSLRPHQRRALGFVKVCFKWSLRAFADCPVLWYEPFVAISVQWQGFRTVVTSSVPFTFNVSAQSDKVAIPFSTDPWKDTVSHDHVEGKLIVEARYLMAVI